MNRIAALLIVGGVAAPVWATDPWADALVSYTEGTGVSAGYNVAASALGEPTRFTGVGVFPGAVTPFNPPFLGSEIVSVGSGGQITLRFGQPVMDDPSHPYGVDFLIFGNAGYADTDYPNGVAGPVFGAGNGGVEVSADGMHWVSAPGVHADGAFPTLGYSDLTDPYSPVAGAVPSDFTRPVNPAFDPAGLSFSQIVAGYAGSGGGTGVDIGALGLSSIQYVRISNPAGSGVTVDVDALAAVAPAPGGVAVIALMALAGARRRRL